MAGSETSSEKAGKIPTHGVFVVEGDGDTARWTRLGVAWPHQDGQGFSLRLAAMPLSGRLVLRANRETGQ